MSSTSTPSTVTDKSEENTNMTTTLETQLAKAERAAHTAAAKAQELRDTKAAQDAEKARLAAELHEQEQQVRDDLARQYLGRCASPRFVGLPGHIRTDVQDAWDRFVKAVHDGIEPHHAWITYQTEIVDAWAPAYIHRKHLLDRERTQWEADGRQLKMWQDRLQSLRDRIQNVERRLSFARDRSRVVGVDAFGKNPEWHTLINELEQLNAELNRFSAKHGGTQRDLDDYRPVTAADLGLVQPLPIDLPGVSSYEPRGYLAALEAALAHHTREIRDRAMRDVEAEIAAQVADELD